MLKKIGLELKFHSNPFDWCVAFFKMEYPASMTYRWCLITGPLEIRRLAEKIEEVNIGEREKSSSKAAAEKATNSDG
jgi:hypothetical protein